MSIPRVDEEGGRLPYPTHSGRYLNPDLLVGDFHRIVIPREFPLNDANSLKIYLGILESDQHVIGVSSQGP